MKLNKILFISSFLELGYIFIYFISRYKYLVNDEAIPSLNFPVILGLVIAAFWLNGFYFLLYYWRHKINWQKSGRILILGVIIFSFALLAFWPLTSSDIFIYIMQGRILGIYHDNPYLSPIGNYSSDPIQPYVFERWLDTPMVYWPIWGLLSAFLALISGSSVVINLFVFRLFMCLCFLLSVYLFYKILAVIKPEIKYWATFLYAYNPLILFETVNNGHNDIVIIALIFLAFYLFLKKKYLPVLPLLILACLIKYVFILILPFVFILLINSVKKKIKFILQNFLIIISIFLICLACFDWGKGMLAGFFFQSNQYWEYYLSFLPALLSGILVWLALAFPIELRIWLIKVFCVSLFFIVYILFLFKYQRDKNFSFGKINKYIIYIFGLYLSVACFLLNEWYIIWLLPWLLFTAQKKYITLFFILTLGGFLASNALSLSLIFVMILAVFILLKTAAHAFCRAKPIPQ